MKSIFRYPGGKSRKKIYQWILSHQPEEMKEYRESMVGGGGIYFNISNQYKRWINDIHPGLIEVYKALRDRSEEFLELCWLIDPPRDDDPKTAPGKRGGEPKNKRMSMIFDALKLDEQCDQAVRYYYVNRTCFAGRVNYDIPSRLYFSNPTGWNILKTGLLEKAAEHLQDTKITCGSYERILFEPGENVWIYVDPPYVVNSEMCRTDQLYQHNFTIKQHIELAKHIKECDHKVAISYDDEEFIRDLYQGFRFEEAAWNYCGSSMKKKRKGQELLILNY